MATLTIRQLDEELKAALRRRAARHGRSMEAEVRAILDQVLRSGTPTEQGLGTRVHQRFSDDSVDMRPPSRDEPARAADVSR
jgi:plasmid stability protein